MMYTVKVEAPITEMLNQIKAIRYTKNTSQVIREAVAHYHSFLFKENTHKRVIIKSN